MDLVFRFGGLFPVTLIDHVNEWNWRGWGPRTCKIMAIDYEGGRSTVFVQVKSTGWHWPEWCRETGPGCDFGVIDFGVLTGPTERIILIEQRLHEEKFSRN